MGAKAAATPPRTTSGLQSKISRRDHQGEKKRLHVTPEEWEQEEEHSGEGGRAVGKPAASPLLRGELGAPTPGEVTGTL